MSWTTSTVQHARWPCVAGVPRSGGRSILCWATTACARSLDYNLAWTQPLKNRHNQNSFSKKLDTTSKRATLAITTSDTNTAICGCVRGCARHFPFCWQPPKCCAHNLKKITVYFFIQSLRFLSIGIQILIQIWMRIRRWKRRPSLHQNEIVKDERFHPPCHAWNTSKPGIHAFYAHHGCRQSEICSLNSLYIRWPQQSQLLAVHHTCTQYSGTTVPDNRIRKRILP